MKTREIKDMYYSALHAKHYGACKYRCIETGQTLLVSEIITKGQKPLNKYPDLIKHEGTTSTENFQGRTEGVRPFKFHFFDEVSEDQLIRELIEDMHYHQLVIEPELKAARASRN